MNAAWIFAGCLALIIIGGCIGVLLHDKVVNLLAKVVEE